MAQVVTIQTWAYWNFRKSSKSNWKFFKRFQWVVLNCQCSSCSSVLAGVPQGSILGPLLFLIYINDLPDNLQSTVKLFADVTSFFSTLYDANISASQQESDLEKRSHWAYKWKMTFNPDLSKQAQKVIFSRKIVKISHPSITFRTVLAQHARTTLAYQGRIQAIFGINNCF